MNKEKILINKLRPGLYKVEIINIKSKKPYYKDEFTVSDRITNNRTKKKFISEKNSFSINLKWKRTGNYPKKPEYTVKVFNSKQEDTVFSKTTNKSFVNFSLKEAGKYTWRVESNVGSSLENSEIFSFTVNRPSFGKIQTPKIILQYIDDKDCYRFKLPNAKYVSRYDVYIYSSRKKVKGKWKTMYHKRLKVNNDCIQSKGEGKYYYKYRLEDKWGRKSSFSSLGEIYFPISPLDDF